MQVKMYVCICFIYACVNEYIEYMYVVKYEHRSSVVFDG